MDGDEHSGAEPEVVRIAHEVTLGWRHPDEFDDAFARATVYGQRPPTPGVLVAQLAGRGKWTLVFSTLDRLAAYASDCDYFATTGADLLDQLPAGIGVMFDAGGSASAPRRQQHDAARTVAEHASRHRTTASGRRRRR